MDSYIFSHVILTQDVPEAGLEKGARGFCIASAGGGFFYVGLPGKPTLVAINGNCLRAATSEEVDTLYLARIKELQLRRISELIQRIKAKHPDRYRAILIDCAQPYVHTVLHFLENYEQNECTRETNFRESERLLIMNLESALGLRKQPAHE